MGVRISVSLRDRGPGGDAAESVYEFEQDRIRIGRGVGSDVALPHRSVSVRHATIELRNGRYVIIDHGSTNGTRVQGTRLVPERPKPLRNGDRIEIGAFVLIWKEGVSVAGSPTAERTASIARRLLKDALGAAAPSGARLVIVHGPQAGEQLEIPPPPARLVIGRGETCDLVLRDAEASREHVELTVDLDGVVVRDLGSKNGLFVDQRRVTSKRLVDRDELVVGATVLVYEDPLGAAVRAIEQGEDEPIAEPDSQTPAPTASAPADDPEAPSGDRESAPASTPDSPSKETVDRSAPAARRGGVSGFELFVYALATIVFAASIAGLWWLFRAGE
jgi:pSer/pThr/pTyr-binding forkhead associated (FHA) protein